MAKPERQRGGPGKGRCLMDKPSRRRQATNQDLDQVAYAAEVIVDTFVNAFDRPLPPLLNLRKRLVRARCFEMADALNLAILQNEWIWKIHQVRETPPPPPPPDPPFDDPDLAQFRADLSLWNLGYDG
jgi:hypothetical protein